MRPSVAGVVPTQRLFFALWPDPSLQARLHALAGTVLPPGDGRIVLEGNLHITLAFLGSVDAGTRACLERCVTTIESTPFTLSLDRVGYWSRPQVMWLGCSQIPAPLASLVEALSACLGDCGVSADSRPYQVHLTLARKVRRHPRCAAIAAIGWPVERFALVASHTDAAGVRYEPLRFWDL